MPRKLASTYAVKHVVGVRNTEDFDKNWLMAYKMMPNFTIKHIIISQLTFNLYSTGDSTVISTAAWQQKGLGFESLWDEGLFCVQVLHVSQRVLTRYPGFVLQCKDLHLGMGELVTLKGSTTLTSVINQLYLNPYATQTTDLNNPHRRSKDVSIVKRD